MMSGDPDHIRVPVFSYRIALTRIAAAALIAGYPADSIGLNQALVWAIPFPWLICDVVHSLFYWSCPQGLGPPTGPGGLASPEVGLLSILAA
jgi:hypothetical protein